LSTVSEGACRTGGTAISTIGKIILCSQAIELAAAGTSEITVLPGICSISSKFGFSNFYMKCSTIRISRF
jgi:hypothetical protein